MDEGREARLLRGGVAGALASVAGLVAATVVADTPAGGERIFRFTLLGSTSELTWSDLDSGGASPPAAYQYAGWLYHETHLASVQGTLTVESGFGESVSAPVAFVAEPSVVLYLVPLVAVGGAAAWLSRQFEPAEASAAAADGAHVAAGYAPVAALSAFVLSWTAPVGGGVIEVGPDLVGAILVTGLLYPLVVGGVAGFAAFEYSSVEPAAGPASAGGGRATGQASDAAGTPDDEPESDAE